MRLFLFVFFIIYGSMHAYAFWKARAGLDFGLKFGIALGLFMLLMIFAPIIVRLTEKAGFELFARFLSYIGYTWLGLLFLFISFAGAIDVYRTIIYISGAILKKDLSFISLSSQLTFYVPLVISLVICIFGYFEALNIRTENVFIKTSKLPEKVDRLKIVQISDVHIGLIVREERLNRILAAAKKAEPDILVSTGDLVDGQIDDLSGLAELLQHIKPRYGKYAVTGNHEYYAGIKQALSFTQRAGFTLLRGKGLTVGGMINIAGVDDIQGVQFNDYVAIDEKELLEKMPQDIFTLFLKHRPMINESSLGLFDLQLSGHTHKGQIFPFSIATWLYYPVDAGCLTPVDGCNMYVSRGSGTWGPPIRFLSPPEVTVIEIVKE
jgi:predicted MPP superfamily phosphohydrolase